MCLPNVATIGSVSVIFFIFFNCSSNNTYIVILLLNGVIVNITDSVNYIIITNNILYSLRIYYIVILIEANNI